MIEDEDVTRALPHAVGPEKSVLSCMMLEPAEFVSEAIDKGLTPESFYLPGHAIVFEQILAIFNSNRPVDIVDLTQHLLDRGLLDRVGGPSALTDIYSYNPSTHSFSQHADRILEKFMLRKVIQTCSDATCRAYESPDEPWDTLDGVESQIMAIRSQIEREGPKTKTQAINNVVENLKAQMEGRKDELGLTTGFEELDRKTGGLKDSELFVLAARPSMGKSALMMNIAEHMSVESEVPGLVFSLEMSQEQLYARTIYSRAKWNPKSLLKPTKVELDRITRATREILNAPIEIDDTPSLSIGEIRARARRAKKKRGIRYVAIDYAQLAKSKSKQAEFSREREVSEISAGCKAMGKELGIPVILLAQLNRDSEKRTGASKGIPRMSDLRESGSIEQDADYVALLHREAYYADNDEEAEAIAGRSRVILAKNRNGETGDVPLTFIPELVRFESGAPAREEPEPPKVQGRFKNQ